MQTVSKLPVVEQGENVDLRLFGPGVYHLMDGDEVVYVGASTSLLGRVNSWGRLIRGEGYQQRYPLDGVRVFFAESESQAASMEEAHIARYRPRLNRAGVDGGYMSPEGLWRQKRRYQVTGDDGDTCFTRVEFIQSLPGDCSLTILRKLKLTPPGGTAVEYGVRLQMLGFPPPDYASNRETPRWMKQTVLAWLTDQGPFDDEIT